MHVIAIDPGTKESAYLWWDGAHLGNFNILPNRELLSLLRAMPTHNFGGCERVCAIESLVNYGAMIGDETFTTALWVGRFFEAWASKQGREPLLIKRPDVKLYHCGVRNAKDAGVREALIHKFGEVGTAKNRGPLYGIRTHLWSALAIATYAHSLAVKQEAA